MSERYGKIVKWYVDHPKDRYKLTFLVHDPGHSSDKCKVMGDFGYNYSKKIPTKDYGNDPADKNKFSRQQENNVIVQNAAD